MYFKIKNRCISNPNLEICSRRVTEEEEIDPEMGGWALLLLVRGFNGLPSLASEAAGVVVPGDWCGEVNPAAEPGGED